MNTIHPEREAQKAPRPRRGALPWLAKSILLLGMLVTIAAGIAHATPNLPAAPGDPDPTFAGFGVGGVVTETDISYAAGMAVQPDGKIVAVSENGPNLVVFRYLSNGQRDETFGDGNGKAVIPPPEGIEFRPNDVALQPDGKIVVAGQTTSGFGDDNNDFLLIRLIPTGELDPLFGNGGIVTTNFSGNQDSAAAVLIQPDGKIVACGSAYIGGDYDFAVARYLPNGAPDPAFSSDGKATIGFGGNDRCYDLDRQSNGKLVLVGHTWDVPVIGDANHDFALARLESNGALDDNSNGDGGFGTGGKVITSFGGDEYANDVVIQPDGKIVVLGSTVYWSEDDQSYIARYMSSGNLDGTFGTGGKKTIPNDILHTLALQPDGKLLALGFHYISPDVSDFAFYRLQSNGAPDPTFGEDGIRWLDFGNAYEEGTDLALLPDGRILGFGRSGYSNLLLVRLWPDGTTFDTGGRQTHGLSPGYYESTYALAVQPDGTFLVAGEGFVPSSFPSNAFVTRFLPDGQVDTSFGAFGTIQPPTIPLFPPDFRGARAIVLQPDGKIVIAGYADWHTSPANILVVRWNSDGTPDFSFGFNGWKLIGFPSDGDDYGKALALAPDGKLVVAGSVWNGTSQVWGVARLTTTGALDPTFGPNQDGRATVEFSGLNSAAAVAVQPDGKIIIAGMVNSDFALVRLLESGLPDPSFGAGGITMTDLGGNDGITALALAPTGWIYAAGYHSGDMALAQYTPEGLLATCPLGETCDYWPEGKRLVDFGGLDIAYALVLREDNQLVAAGCSDQHMAAAQVSTADVNAPPLLFQTDFVGGSDCAYGVQFTNAAQNKFILAGAQFYDSDKNIALARFETADEGTPPTPTPGPSPTPDPSPTPTPPPPAGYPIFLPVILK